MDTFQLGVQSIGNWRIHSVSDVALLTPTTLRRHHIPQLNVDAYFGSPDNLSDAQLHGLNNLPLHWNSTSTVPETQLVWPHNVDHRTNRPYYKPVTRVRLRLKPILAHRIYITTMTLPRQAQ